MNIELSIVMPCLNEAETLQSCIKKAMHFLNENNVVGEIIIGDNGSTDGSQAIAISCGARVVNVKNKGYGCAIMGAIAKANGKYIILGDSDDSYDFENLHPFLQKLREGYDLVMGNRFLGGIKPGAMPFLHRYLGNPVLSFIGRLFFKSKIGDFHCGLRGLRKELVSQLNLHTSGMEFASEMIVKATIHNFKIIEVPTTLSPAGRSRPPHLRTWQDGWRHLRFLLIYSPTWLFQIPGTILIILGFLLSILILNKPISFGGIKLDNNSLLYAASFVIIGFQAINFALFTQAYGVKQGFLPKNQFLLNVQKYVTLERGIFIGFIILVIGLTGSIYSVYEWNKVNFGNLNYIAIPKIVIPSVMCIILGLQIIFSSFFLSVLDISYSDIKEI